MKRPTMFLTMLLTGLLLGWPHSAASKRVVAEGRQYLSLDEVGYRYGMRAVDNRMADRKRILIFQRDKRQFTINGVRYYLGFAPLTGEDGMFLSALDVTKQLDPILKPRIVPRHTVRHIVLDPGHGGKDTGALGARSREKYLTLMIARRVRDRLVRAGYRVTMTRHTDIALTLAQRAALAQALKADLFVSIHINAVQNASLSGIETYALSPAGAPSTSGGKAAATVHPGNRCDLNNLALANMIHRYLLGRTGGSDRGVKRARFAVLRDITMPGVLVECGFITNRAEELRMMTPAYQEKLARGIADGITAYRLSILRNPTELKK